MRPVLVAHSEPDDFRDLLADRFPDVEFAYATTAQGISDALARHDPEAAFSIKHPGFPASGHVPIPAHPSVRWIQIGGSGFDHLLPWDTERVTVTNGAGVLAPYLAESVTGAMLALGCGFLGYLGQQRARQWRPVAFTPLRGRTLLVVGFGRIGECVARNAKALGMRVLAIRGRRRRTRRRDEMHGPDAFHEAAFPRGLRVAARAAQSRDPRAAVARRVRGDEAGRVSRQHRAGAGGRRGGADRCPALRSSPRVRISTFSTPSRCLRRVPLWAMPNVLVTPHSADNIHGWPRRFAALFADNLERWRSGEPLLNVVASAVSALRAMRRRSACVLVSRTRRRTPDAFVGRIRACTA